ncbi:hypothetical protein D3C76_205200 [compost metagenome]
MAILLDARTSMNINATDPAPDPIPVSVAFLIGQVGLIVPSDTPGIIRVQFDGIFGLELPVEPETSTNVTLFIVNGTLSTDPIVYSSIRTFNTSLTNNQLVPLSASAYDVPAPVSNQLVYTLFGIVDTTGVLRSGPENFNAAAYSL